MQRRHFLAAPAALAGLVLPVRFRTHKPSDNERRFRVLHSNWAPRGIIMPLELGGFDLQSAWVEYDRRLETYPSPEHPLDIPPQCGLGDEIYLDGEDGNELLTRAEAFRRAAAANAKLMRTVGPDECSLETWMLVAEVGPSEKRSFGTVSIGPDGIGEEDRTLFFSLTLVRPTAAEIARYADWRSAA